MKTVFFGSSSYVIPVIEKVRVHFEIAHVFTTEKNQSNPVPSYCNKTTLPFSSVTTLSDTDTLYKLHAADAPFAILADFGLIIPPHLFHAFPKGIINIHPSLLPKYRGPTPVQSAILLGDQKTGVTIIRLDEQIDHGPILTQKEESIHPYDTAQSLYQRLFEIGTDILLSHIQDYLSDKTQLKEQDHSLATYTKELSRADGYIDVHTPPAKDVIERMTRAYHPWPGVWTKFEINNRETRVKLLSKQMLQVEGKRPMSVKDFLNGYPELKDIITKLL